MASDRTTKAERRRARREWPAECRRSGVGRTVRRIRDGWGAIRMTVLDLEGREVVAPKVYFGKIEAVYE